MNLETKVGIFVILGFFMVAITTTVFGNLDFNSKEGKTIFFSTHILDVAEKLCDRVAIIKNGDIVKIGKMKDIKKDTSLEQVFLELGEK